MIHTKEVLRRLNTKATEIENKIPEINSLTAKTEIEFKKPKIVNLVTKATVNRKDREIVNKIPDLTGFITTAEFNRLAKNKF